MKRSIQASDDCIVVSTAEGRCFLIYGSPINAVPTLPTSEAHPPFSRRCSKSLPATNTIEQGVCLRFIYCRWYWPAQAHPVHSSNQPVRCGEG